METKVNQIAGLKEGDNNTSFFFHKMTSTHTRRNSINNVKVNGVGLSKYSDLKEVANASRNLLSEMRKVF